MKKNTWLLVAAAMLVLAVLFTGCPKEVETVSVSERMTMFIQDANSEAYDNLKAHMHPSATAYPLVNYTWWDTFFNGGSDQPLTLVSISGSTATVSITGSITLTFTLQEDDKDIYKIRTITAAPAGHDTFE